MSTIKVVPGVISTERKGESRNNSYYVVLSWIILLLTLAILSSGYLWHYTKQQQLAQLKQTAERRLALYSSKIKAEFGQNRLTLLQVLSKHPVVQNFLDEPGLESQQQVQNYLNNINNSMPNLAIFVGKAKHQVVASMAYQADLRMLEDVFHNIAARSFKGKSSRMFLFYEDMITPKYLMVVPVSDEDNIRGFIGVLLDLSDFQRKLAQSWTAPDETLVVSDQRGIITLSSDPAWLYRTFSNLPYGVKKSLGVSFEQQRQFRQLGVANVEDQILTLKGMGTHISNDSYLVHSMSLADLQLRIHHLSNIAPVEKNSATYTALAWTCFILVSLLLLLLKEKKASLQLEIAHQQRLRAHEAELKQHHKLAAMGMMATNLAHQISQPVTSIKTEATISKKYLQRGDMAESGRSLETIIGYTHLLANITSQLKNFARKSKTATQAIANVYESIQYSHILYQHRLKSEHVHWSESIDDRDLYVQIDEYQLQQVVGNLIQNACDAMKNCAVKQLSVRVSTEDEYLYIDIADSGEGIDADLQQSVFEPFVSTKNKSSSMGLGLAICKDILTQAHGNIELLKSHQGANFRIILLRNDPDGKQIKEKR